MNTEDIMRLKELPVTLTAAELAGLIRVSAKSIYEAVKRGEIPGAFWVGRRLLFNTAAVLDWTRGARGAGGAGGKSPAPGPAAVVQCVPERPGSRGKGFDP